MIKDLFKLDHNASKVHLDKSLSRWDLAVPLMHIKGGLRYHDGDSLKKMSLKKRICVLSISIAITPTHLLCQMQANSF